MFIAVNSMQINRWPIVEFECYAMSAWIGFILFNTLRVTITLEEDYCTKLMPPFKTVFILC